MRTPVLLALLSIALPTIAAAPLTFEEVDTDGDGLISADEAASVNGLDFDAADADRDGTLSVDEYEIAVENLAPPTEDDQASSAESDDSEDSEDSVKPATPPTPRMAPTPSTVPTPSTASTPSSKPLPATGDATQSPGHKPSEHKSPEHATKP